MEDVTAMLGRPFGFCFEVVHGNHIGHTIGTPTINQNFPPRFVLPRFGVYASAVYVDGKTYCGVTNVGVKPPSAPTTRFLKPGCLISQAATCTAEHCVWSF